MCKMRSSGLDTNCERGGVLLPSFKSKPLFLSRACCNPSLSTRLIFYKTGDLVETDAQQVVNLLQDSNLRNHYLSNIIYDCRLILQRLQAEIKQVLREANHCADTLAKSNFVCNSLVIFNSSRRVRKHLLHDANGVQYPRMMTV